jgi:hypothetical protein
MGSATAGPTVGLPRLLSSLAYGEPLGLDRHLEAHGPLPGTRQLDGGEIVDLVERAGLRGRGGAAFPTATKLRAVRAARGRPIVVANGCESEPISAKDALLMRELPHLVLDGAAIAARAVGADAAVIAFEESNPDARSALEQALSERRAARTDQLRFSLFAAEERFLSGQETALVSQLNGGPAKPTFVPPRPTDRGVSRRPTLIQNVETLANLALLARYGTEWYRELGTEAEPGSRLVTLAGAVELPGVYEIECGTPLPGLLAAAGGLSSKVAGVLIGGYFGSWLPPAAVGDMSSRTRALAATEPGSAAGLSSFSRPPRAPSPKRFALPSTWRAKLRASAARASTDRRRLRARCMASLRVGARGMRSPTSRDGPPSCLVVAPATTRTGLPTSSSPRCERSPHSSTTTRATARASPVQPSRC